MLGLLHPVPARTRKQALAQGDCHARSIWEGSRGTAEGLRAETGSGGSPRVFVIRHVAPVVTAASHPWGFRKGKWDPRTELSHPRAGTGRWGIYTQTQVWLVTDRELLPEVLIP